MNSACTGKAADVVMVGAGLGGAMAGVLLSGPPVWPPTEPGPPRTFLTGLFAMVDAFIGGQGLGGGVVNRTIMGSDLPGVPRVAFKIGSFIVTPSARIITRSASGVRRSIRLLFRPWPDSVRRALSLPGAAVRGTRQITRGKAR